MLTAIVISVIVGLFVGLSIAHLQLGEQLVDAELHLHEKINAVEERIKSHITGAASAVKLPAAATETYEQTVADINGELATGQQLAEQLVAHVRRMGADGTTFEVFSHDVMVIVTVRAEETPR